MKHTRKISVNMVSFSFLYMFMKKEENCRLTYSKIEIAWFLPPSPHHPL